MDVYFGISSITMYHEVLFFNLRMLPVFLENLCTNRFSSSIQKVFSSPYCINCNLLCVNKFPKFLKISQKEMCNCDLLLQEASIFSFFLSHSFSSNIFKLRRPLFLHLKNDRLELDDPELYEIQISEEHSIIPEQCCLCIIATKYTQIALLVFVKGFTKSSFLLRICK